MNPVTCRRRSVIRPLGRSFRQHPKSAGDRAKLWARARDEGVAEGGEPGTDDAGRAVDAAIGLVAVSACELAIVPAEDLFAVVEAPNLPGTTDEHPNWRRRLPADAATLFADPAVAARCAALTEARR